MSTQRRPEMDEYDPEDIATLTLRRKVAYCVMQVGWLLLDKRARRAYMLALDYGVRNLGRRVKITDPYEEKARP